VFPCMESLLAHLKSKNYQKRTVGIIENGSWAPMAGKVMKESLSQMKEITILEPMVTIKSTLNEASEAQLEQLAQALV
ncbi:MAG: FprA family A-type flavoprotein, partial [Lachnospiraceae bacterium]|nr:FprA family A-type flavoprotein [Lachnospiraceae bacterium]